MVAAPPCGDGQAYTSLLDLTLLTGATLVAAPLPLMTAAMRVYKGTAAIVPRGTHVPGVPPERVFSVALSPVAVLGVVGSLTPCATGSWQVHGSHLAHPRLGAASRESSSRGDGLSHCSLETCGCDAPRMPGPGGRQTMSIGPVEYLILGFPGNRFTGQIVPELAKLIDSGLVRIIDLIFISKDADGDVTVVEYDAVEELAAFAGLDAEVGGLLTDEDVAHAALSLEPNSSAALLVWEDTWAAPFAAAVRNANGVILEGARIPREIIEEAMVALDDALA